MSRSDLYTLLPTGDNDIGEVLVTLRSAMTPAEVFNIPPAVQSIVRRLHAREMTVWGAMVAINRTGKAVAFHRQRDRSILVCVVETKALYDDQEKKKIVHRRQHSYKVLHYCATVSGEVKRAFRGVLHGYDLRRWWVEPCKQLNNESPGQVWSKDSNWNKKIVLDYINDWNKKIVLDYINDMISGCPS